MSPRSALDVVSPAFEHMKRQLWPFQWGQWWRLAVVGILAGELGGFGCGGSTGMPGGNSAPNLPDWGSGSRAPIEMFALVVMAAAFIFVLMLLFLYVNSRFRFILIDAVVQRRCEGIRAGWRKWRTAGRRFFLWQIAFQFTVVLFFGAVIGTVLMAGFGMGGFSSMRSALPLLILGAMLAFMVLAALFVTAIVAFVIAKDFMAPILAIDQAGIRGAWRRTWSIMADDKLAFAGYILLKLVLSIAAAMAVGVVVLVLLVPVVGAAIIGGISTGGNITWTPGVIATFMAVGVLFVVWLMACVSLASVPFTVFFPAFGLHFLASRYEPLERWMNRADDQMTR